MLFCFAVDLLLLIFSLFFVRRVFEHQRQQIRFIGEEDGIGLSVRDNALRSVNQVLEMHEMVFAADKQFAWE